METDTNEVYQGSHNSSMLLSTELDAHLMLNGFGNSVALINEISPLFGISRYSIADDVTSLEKEENDLISLCGRGIKRSYETFCTGILAPELEYEFQNRRLRETILIRKQRSIYDFFPSQAGRLSSVAVSCPSECISGGGSSDKSSFSLGCEKNSSSGGSYLPMITDHSSTQVIFSASCYSCKSNESSRYISATCSFCSKGICLSCIVHCEGCTQQFCKFCSCKNYTLTIERTFCLDCASVDDS